MKHSLIFIFILLFLEYTSIAHTDSNRLKLDGNQSQVFSEIFNHTTSICSFDQIQFNFKNLDSATVEIYDHVSKEMTSAPEEERFILLNKILIPRVHFKQISKLINSSSSYNSNRALLTHSNIVFSFYFPNKEKFTTEISSLTRNFSVGTDSILLLSSQLSKKGVNRLKKILKDLLLTSYISEDLFFKI